MLTVFKHLLRQALVPILFFGGIGVVVASIFKDALWGFYLLVTLIPQPNIWYKFHGYVAGKDFMDILFLAVLAGIFVQKKGFAKTKNVIAILLFVFVSYLALWNSSSSFNLPLPISHANELLYDWKNFAQMVFLYFLALNVIKNERQQRTAIVIMCIVILFIALRSYRNFTGGTAFSWDKRDGGPFEAVGLGANHFGAFISYYITVFLGLFFFDADKKRKILYITTYLFGLHPLLFAYSRGAYLSALGALAFFGLTKKRILLVAVIAVIIGYKTFLPVSVVDRIEMTETSSGQLDKSSAHRLVLWVEAINAFKQHPIFGVGFEGFRYIIPKDQRLTDTHNFFVRILCEEGLVGFSLLLIIFIKAFRSGFRLFKTATDDFEKGLGFGFMGCVLALAIANMFGDRFSYFPLGGYFWIFWGLVDKGILLAQAGDEVIQEESVELVSRKVPGTIA